MTDFSKTISNSIDLFGSAQTTKWDGFNWDENNWGESLDKLTISVLKNFNESIIPSDSLSVSANFNRSFSDSISISYANIDENLYEGEWQYVFTKPTIDAEERTSITWTEV